LLALFLTRTSDIPSVSPDQHPVEAVAPLDALPAVLAGQANVPTLPKQLALPQQQPALMSLDNDSTHMSSTSSCETKSAPSRTSLSSTSIVLISVYDPLDAVDQQFTVPAGQEPVLKVLIVANVLPFALMFMPSSSTSKRSFIAGSAT
jgi:hypothetical protein